MRRRVEVERVKLSASGDEEVAAAVAAAAGFAGVEFKSAFAADLSAEFVVNGAETDKSGGSEGFSTGEDDEDNDEAVGICGKSIARGSLPSYASVASLGCVCIQLFQNI